LTDHTDIYFSYDPSSDYYYGHQFDQNNRSYHYQPKKRSFIEFLEKRSDGLYINVNITENDNNFIVKPICKQTNQDPQHIFQKKNIKKLRSIKKIIDDNNLVVVPCLMNTTDTNGHWNLSVRYIGFTVMLLNDFQQLPFVTKMDLNKIVKHHKENIYCIKDDDFDLIQYISNKMTRLRTISKYGDKNDDPQLSS
jgi:hypothetical protein